MNKPNDLKRKLLLVFLAIVLVGNIQYAQAATGDITKANVICRGQGIVTSSSQDFSTLLGEAQDAAIADAKFNALQNIITTMNSETNLSSPTLGKDEILKLAQGKITIITQPKYYQSEINKDSANTVVTLTVEFNANIIITYEMLCQLQSDGNCHKYKSKIDSLLGLIPQGQKEKNYRKIINYCSQILALNPLDADIYFIRAETYVKQVLWRESLADYNKLIEIKPRHFGAYLGKGMVLERLSNSAEALKAYQQYLEYAPSDHKQRESVEDRVKQLENLINPT